MDEDDVADGSRSAMLDLVDGGGFSLPVLAPSRSLESIRTVLAKEERGVRTKHGETMAANASDEQDMDKERDIVEGHAAHFRDDPVAFVSQMAAWASGQGWRSYTNYVGTPVFYPEYSRDIKRDLLARPGVRQRIDMLVQRRMDQLLAAQPSLSSLERQSAQAKLDKQLHDVAEHIADGLIAKMDSLPFLRAFGASINQLLVRVFDKGLNIQPDEFARFRSVAVAAAEKKQSLILLPCHKSHFDYLTISFLCFRLGIALPHIAAGENLNIPVVGSALKKCGAFFIRRQFQDEFYEAIVSEYISLLLSQGHNLEESPVHARKTQMTDEQQVFLEGTRSRTGKLLQPKFGLLSYILDAVLRGATEDVLICPISLQYDKVIEAETYISELLGRPKEQESLLGLLSNSSLLGLKLGRIDVRFNTPFSLRAFIAEQRQRRSASQSDAPVDFRTNREHRAVLLRSLGYRVLNDVNGCAIIMPASLVGTVLLTLRGRGVGRSELIRRVDWLRTAIVERGGRVASFHGASTGEIVDRTVITMRDLIGTHNDLLEPTFYAIKRFQLSFSRNALLHLFISEALVCAVLYTRVKKGGGALNQRMKLDDVLRELSWLSQLLATEFVFAMDGLASNADSTISSLQREKVLKIEDGWLGLAQEERLNGRERYDFSCFLIWPFIEGYWTALVALFALCPPEPAGSLAATAHPTTIWYEEKDFLGRAQLLAKQLYYQGDLSYLEAVNQATLLNALQRFRELGIVLSKREKAVKSVSIIALHPDFSPRRDSDGNFVTEGRLWSMLEHLGTFRREGKNRRDAGTLPTRVLPIVASVAPAPYLPLDAKL